MRTLIRLSSVLLITAGYLLFLYMAFDLGVWAGGGIRSFAWQTMAFVGMIGFTALVFTIVGREYSNWGLAVKIHDYAAKAAVFAVEEAKQPLLDEISTLKDRLADEIARNEVDRLALFEQIRKTEQYVTFVQEECDTWQRRLINSQRDMTKDEARAIYSSLDLLYTE